MIQCQTSICMQMIQRYFKEVNTTCDSQSLQLFVYIDTGLPLRFHPEKHVAMHVGNSLNEVLVTYTMSGAGGGVPLSVSNEEKDLGVLIDSKLNFDRHIGVKVNNANSDESPRGKNSLDIGLVWLFHLP